MAAIVMAAPSRAPLGRYCARVPLGLGAGVPFLSGDHPFKLAPAPSQGGFTTLASAKLYLIYLSSVPRTDRLGCTLLGLVTLQR